MGTVVVVKERQYDPASQTLVMKRLYHFIDTDQKIPEEFKMKIYFPQEIDTLIRWSGFKIEGKLGDYDYSPFTSDSQRQLIICQPG